MSATAAKSCGSPAVYHRRQPERTVLYHVVQAHLATWLALHDGGCGGRASALTEREFRRYLECGILAHGFARARCPDCGHNFIVAYSCKGRGICPSEQGLRKSLPEKDGATQINTHIGASSSSTASAVCSMPICIFMC